MTSDSLQLQRIRPNELQPVIFHIISTKSKNTDQYLTFQFNHTKYRARFTFGKLILMPKRIRTVFNFKIKKVIFLTATLLSFFCVRNVPAMEPVTALPKTSDLTISQASVRYLPDMDMLVFMQQVQGKIGQTFPKAKGQFDGAPVLGYVFPTTLKPEDVGFNSTAGILALAVTVHPDFDDTPLWDENNDGNYKNDGSIFHTHWVVLAEDKRVPGGLSVKEFKKTDKAVVLPPTNPDMPMYMDSPGYSVAGSGSNCLRVFVPAQRVNNKKNFNYDAVSAYMQINTSDKEKPLLGVYQVYSVLSKDLSMPYTVEGR